MPWSPRWRMRRPNPCLSDSAARGSWYDPNGSPPSSRMRSMRAAVSGSSGTAKGISIDHHQRQRLAGDVDPLPEALRRQQHGADLGPQRRQQEVARALALHQQRERKSALPRR